MSTKTEQNAITTNSNNGFKINEYKDPFDVVVVFVFDNVILRQGHGLIRQTGALLM